METQTVNISIDYLNELIWQYEKDNYGEYPNYIMLSIKDAIAIEKEMYCKGLIFNKEPNERLRICNAEIIKGFDINEGEIILSRK